RSGGPSPLQQPARRHAQDPGRHSQGDAGLRLRASAKGRRRAAREICCVGNEGQSGRQGRLYRGEQVDLRGIRSGSARLDGAYPASDFARQVAARSHSRRGPAMSLDRVRHAYGIVLDAIVVVLMAAIAIEVTIGVVYRAIGQSLSWYDEVAVILLAWLTFYGSALAALKRAHIGFPGIVNSLAPRVRLPVVILGKLIVIG